MVLGDAYFVVDWSTIFTAPITRLELEVLKELEAILNRRERGFRGGTIREVL